MPLTTKPRMMPIKNLAKNGPVGVLKRCCTTRLARTCRSTRTRRCREQYVPLVAFWLRQFSADSIICMCEFDFRQTQVSRRHSRSGFAQCCRLDHDRIRLNPIMVSSLCLSTISGQTLRVRPVGKPVSIFPDHSLTAREHQIHSLSFAATLQRAPRKAFAENVL